MELTAIVEAVIADAIAGAEEAGIDLGAELQRATVRGIGWLLTEAIKALTHNALEHTPAGGSVTLRCGGDAGAAYIEVVDTGVGIPKPERERVLERFFRASNARGSGSGLGLAIVKEVTELHGGTLTIDTGPAAAGRRVRLELPANPAVDVAMPAGAPASVARRATG